MDYSFRPQWRTWTFNTSCVRCGFYQHRHGQCPAIHKQCYKCKKFGHFARQCWSKYKFSYKPTTQHVHVKSKRKRERDNLRLQRYLDTKALQRELPFSSVRHNAFLQLLNPAGSVKVELQTARKSLELIKSSSAKDTEVFKQQILNLTSENTVLKQEVDSLRQKPNEQNCAKLKEYSDKIKYLESEREQDKTFIRIITDRYTTVSEENEELSKRCEEHSKKIQILTEQLNRLSAGKHYNCDNRNKRFRNNNFRGRF